MRNEKEEGDEHQGKKNEGRVQARKDWAVLPDVLHRGGCVITYRGGFRGCCSITCQANTLARVYNRDERMRDYGVVHHAMLVFFFPGSAQWVRTIMGSDHVNRSTNGGAP